MYRLRNVVTGGFWTNRVYRPCIERRKWANYPLKKIKKLCVMFMSCLNRYQFSSKVCLFAEQIPFFQELCLCVQPSSTNRYQFSRRTFFCYRKDNDFLGCFFRSNINEQIGNFQEGTPTLRTDISAKGLAGGCFRFVVISHQRQDVIVRSEFCQPLPKWDLSWYIEPLCKISHLFTKWSICIQLNV